MKLEKKWIVGFTDGDGCFSISTQKTYPGTNRNDIFYKHAFIISQNKRSVAVLHALEYSLGCGSVHKAGGDMMEFKVADQEQLEKQIVPFFQKNPLRTKKKTTEFEVFKKSLLAYRLRKRGVMPLETVEAYKKLKEMKASSEKRKQTFLELVTNDEFLSSLLDEPVLMDKNQKDQSLFMQDSIEIPSLDCYWLASFIDADGCFSCSFVDEYPKPQLLIAAILKELPLFFKIKHVFQLGTVRVRKTSKSDYAIFQVSSIQQLTKILIPLLFTIENSCLLKTTKAHSLEIFRQILNLIEKKEHLTEKGKIKIAELRLSLNPKI